MKIVLATRNQGKVKELVPILEPLGFELITQDDFGIASPEETGKTFIENALIKAREVSRFSGLPSIADDSGICAPALMGQPGIYSARYAGLTATDQENNQKLVKALENQSIDDAFYYCVLVFIRHEEDPTPIIGMGEWHGAIIQSPKGQNGFGYDPYFWLDEYKCTAAELLPETKNRISHRAHASQDLMTKLRKLSF